MKKGLIFSDTHHRNGALLSVLAAYPSADFLVHLGDGLSSARGLLLETGLPVVCVRGNNDFDDAVPEEALFTVEGVPVFAAHGHRFRVKSGLSDLFKGATARGAGLVLFGHTHRPETGTHGGLTYLNPGALQPGQSETFSEVTIDNGAVSCRTLNLKDAMSTRNEERRLI